MKLKQIIPNKLCLSCGVCCRFIDINSLWAPLFLPHEITKKIRPYLAGTGRVRLKNCGDIYICPFFSKDKDRCSIYSTRPFDCRLYPFILTFDEGQKSIVLGIDTKCPFISEPKNQINIKKYSKYLADILEQKNISLPISQNPLFIGNFRSDIIKVSSLNTLTKILINNPEKTRFKRLELKDKAVFDRYFKKSKNPHSSESFITLYIWKDIHEIWWKKKDNALEILIESGADFLPFYSMKRYADYVYLRKDLVELKGNAFKHKRASCNYFSKHYEFQYLSFNKNMKAECLRLFSKWAKERKQKFNNSYYCQLLEDSWFAHKTALKNYKALGLAGRVVKIKNKICGYTFGFELTKDMFCVLLEVTDLRFRGISEFIFREFCREMKQYKYINTMDDSGLENLRVSKLSYHPLPQQIWSKSH